MFSNLVTLSHWMIFISVNHLMYADFLIIMSFNNQIVTLSWWNTYRNNEKKTKTDAAGERKRWRRLDSMWLLFEFFPFLSLFPETLSTCIKVCFLCVGVYGYVSIMTASCLYNFNVINNGELSILSKAFRSEYPDYQL